MQLLKRQDPIIFYDEVILYEDELADNGSAVMSVRLRVMPERMLLLCRYFLRLDNVVFRVRDTRLYIEFKTGEIMREHLEREDTWENVKRKIQAAGSDDTSLLDNANWLSERLPILSGTMETLVHS